MKQKRMDWFDWTMCWAGLLAVVAWLCLHVYELATMGNR